MISVVLRKSGGSMEPIDVENGQTIRDVLDKANISNVTEVTFNGVITQNLSQPVAEGSVVFVATAQKAG